MAARRLRIQFENGEIVDVPFHEGKPRRDRRPGWSAGRVFAACLTAAGVLFEVWLGAWAFPRFGFLVMLVVHVLAAIMAAICVPMIRNWQTKDGNHA